ncbi:MAG: hypothetical protein P4L53_22585 [Candidatus Obscuribacterales bacterium]|nr:hypothetical protein [Candidatus Obscuribacterales bacterium]
MPTANIYTSDNAHKEAIVALSPKLRAMLAEELTSGSHRLTSREISIRVIEVCTESSMIAPVEIEIKAHAYGDRAPRADQICLAIRKFVKNNVPSAADVRVWIMLAELGHSWEE